jgi:hypothetical protein
LYIAGRAQIAWQTQFMKILHLLNKSFFSAEGPPLWTTGLLSPKTCSKSIMRPAEILGIGVQAIQHPLPITRIEVCFFLVPLSLLAQSPDLTHCVSQPSDEKRPGSSCESGRVQVELQSDFLAALTFAHRVRCAAAILRRALADIVRFLGIVTTLAFPLLAFTFAQRARWAAAILALPAEDILRRVAVPFVYAAPKADSAAPIAFISLLNRACSFLNICTTPLRFVIEFPLAGILAGGSGSMRLWRF